MSKELKFEFNDYIIAIDGSYENDCGCVVIGKKDTKDNINIWFMSLNQQTVDFYIELQKHIADLEAKVAEKDLRIEELESQFAYECECNKQFVECQKENEELKQQLEESDAYKLRIELAGADEIISQLKQQLAEKDRQILELQEQSIRDNQIYNEELAEKEKEIENLEQRISDKSTALYGAELMARDVQWHLEKQIHELKQAHQDKISFAVEQLEWVEKLLLDNAFNDLSVVFGEIDNQIKQLKEGK